VEDKVFIKDIKYRLLSFGEEEGRWGQAGWADIFGTREWHNDDAM